MPKSAKTVTTLHEMSNLVEFMGCDIPQHLANCRLEHDVSGNVTCQRVMFLTCLLERV